LFSDTFLHKNFKALLLEYIIEIAEEYEEEDKINVYAENVINKFNLPNCNSIFF
jgi:hypothetical protein